MGGEQSLFEKSVDSFGGPEAFLAFLQAQDPAEVLRLSYDWRFLARPKQIMPSRSWSTWSIRAGRGFGKTRVGAETVRILVEQMGYSNGALVGATAADVRDTMIEGPSGIIATSPPWFMPLYEPSKRRLTWPNGAIATLFSAEEPDRLRGPDKDFSWCDELASWQRLQDSWDMLMFTLRRGHDPKCIITSTPRGLKLLREIEKDKTTAVTIGSTYENKQNLAAPFLKKIEEKYAGTRLGRQEIDAEILDDNPGALWKRAHIDAKRLTLAEFANMGEVVSRIVVSLDPATTSNASSDENGIVAVGAGWCTCNGKREMHGFVFEDATEIYTPNETCLKVLDVHRRRAANMVVGETNQGGDWIEALLRANSQTSNLRYKGVHAKDGKRLRADPVAALYEQGRVHHVGTFPKLEDEMTQWDPGQSLESPNRVDALVHGLTELVVTAPPPAYSARVPNTFHTARR
jgi:phage terminase large subunit-like protein